MSDYPTVQIHSLYQNPDFPNNAVVRVKCPFCQKIHTHGMEWSETKATHRHSECDTRSGYYVSPDNLKILRDKLGE